ncbi:MAG: DUF302 domain-containing protein [Pseudomonadota bacterium]
MLRQIRLALLLALALPALVMPALAAAGPIEPREGWVVTASEKPYADLLTDLKAAIKAEKMIKVTEAGPTGAAKSRGITIPGNRVLGVFRNDFAVRILRLSTPAMIEAPIRFYVTEAPDGRGWLSYRTPSAVFAPYAEDGGAALAEASAELDTIFAAIAARALGAGG